MASFPNNQPVFSVVKVNNIAERLKQEKRKLNQQKVTSKREYTKAGYSTVPVRGLPRDTNKVTSAREQARVAQP